MSQRFLVEFNTDFMADWPEEVQTMLRAAMDKRYNVERRYPGINCLWQRHHQDPCPVEYYLGDVT